MHIMSQRIHNNGVFYNPGVFLQPIVFALGWSIGRYKWTYRARGFAVIGNDIDMISGTILIQSV